MIAFVDNILWKCNQMASITIRNLDDTTKEKLRLRAAAHGRSMEEEVRLLLAGLGDVVPVQTGSAPVPASQMLVSGSLIWPEDSPDHRWRYRRL